MHPAGKRVTGGDRLEQLRDELLTGRQARSTRRALSECGGHAGRDVHVPRREQAHVAPPTDVAADRWRLLVDLDVEPAVAPGERGLEPDRPCTEDRRADHPLIL